MIIEVSPPPGKRGQDRYIGIVYSGNAYLVAENTVILEKNAEVKEWNFFHIGFLK